MQQCRSAIAPGSTDAPVRGPGAGHVRLALKGGDLIGLENGRGVLVQLVSGQLWITQSDDYRDVIVEPGESFRLDRDGLALVTAIIDADVVVAPRECTLGRLRFERTRR